VQPGLKISALLKKGSNSADSVKVKTVKPKTTVNESKSGDTHNNDQQE
jgi:hypothetical protein